MPFFINKAGNELLNLQYSTEEQFTGKYWIDSKKIYQKVIIKTITNERDITIPLNITNLRQIIEVKIVAGKADTNIFYPVPAKASITGNYIENWAIVNGSLRMFMSLDLNTDLNIIVSYTKN